ncbi:MAG: beta-ketoacyl synthase N-terminal-like domain-containing protein [Bradymonadia bacterium]
MEIAITGVGLLTPLGLSLEATLEGLKAGHDPRRTPTEDEGAAAPGIEVCPLPEGFNPKPFLRRRKDLKLMARANRIAVVASALAARDAGLEEGDTLRAAGLFIGVGREPGNLDDLLPMLSHSLGDTGQVDLDRLIDEGMGWMNPLSSLKTLPNMSPAHVAITLGITGHNHALCAEAESGVTALEEALVALEEGRVQMAFAGAADSRVDLTDRISAARALQAGAEEPTRLGEGAAILVLEPIDAARARGAQIKGVIRRHADDGSTTAGPWGDCGAATSAMNLVSTFALKGRAQHGTLTLTARPSSETPRAPAAHTRRGIDGQAVAITGIGLRTPLGHTFGAFTEALLAGRCGSRTITRFDARRFPVKVACEVDGPLTLPDPLEAAMAGLEDRKGELALTAALDAVASVGGLPVDAGLVYATGLSSATATELNQDYAPWLRDGVLDLKGLGAHRFSERPQSPWRHRVDRPARLLRTHLGLTGPWGCHFSACAAGSAAVGHGADLIRRGAAPMVLAGGADSMVHPFGLLPFIRLGATTEEPDPARAGRPFDVDRSGFVMGEGAAFFALEPYAAARAAGRRIYGVLSGWGASLDAYNVTAPHPEGAGASQAMQAALSHARWAPDRVEYVNAHGTGTALNDVAESLAIRSVFGDAPPPVSSSKAQVGHAIAAAGAVELTACLAAFAGDALPPNPHTEHVDPAIDLDLVGPVGRPGAPAALLSNSFGFGGQNACLALAHPEAVDGHGSLN